MAFVDFYKTRILFIDTDLCGDSISKNDKIVTYVRNVCIGLYEFQENFDWIERNFCWTFDGIKLFEYNPAISNAINIEINVWK